MSKPIPDIIEDFVNKVSFTQKGNNLVTVDNVSTFDTCNTWFAVKGGYVVINSIEYLIKEVVQDVSITVYGTPIVVGTFTWGLQNPFFIHGTPSQANVERELHRNNKDVTPMVYLFEPIREDFNNELDSIERSISVRLACLHNYSKEQITDEIYDFSIRAMRKYSELLIETIKNQVGIVDPETITYNFTSYAKYGNFIDRQGSNKNLFNEELSGIEIILNIDLKRQDKCLSSCSN